MKPHQQFHLIFSFVMGAMMISLMTFVITMINVDWSARFLQLRATTFVIAFAVGVPVIFFPAPLARGLTQRLLDSPG